jgi:hypothetical protein
MTEYASQHAAAVSFLGSIGTQKVDHSSAGLFAHLEATSDLLRRWGNSDDICLAGLCHAVYGTDGFETALLEISQRDEVKAAIGEAAEAVVYFYASCDRKFFYPLIGSTPLRFRDRFRQTEFEPAEDMICACLELLLANDVEIAYREGRFLDYTRTHYSEFFLRSKDFVSSSAFSEYCDVYDVRP